MPVTLEQVISLAVELRCSDIHISVGLPIAFRINGQLQTAPFNVTVEESEIMIRQMLHLVSKEELESITDLDFAFSLGEQRHRANIYKQQGRATATIHLINRRIPSFESLGLPNILRTFAEEPRGLILITGPTGSGKSTTLAAMIEWLNNNHSYHILTIEDPIEYIFKSQKCLIHQREVGKDVPSFATALRAALREDPDVMMVGEMRDFETISAAVTAAETGQLVLGTLHTIGAAQTIERVIGAFPPSAQAQIRTQLAGVLKGIVTQQLIPRQDTNNRIVATEVLVVNEGVAHMIRENKIHQLDSQMQSGAAVGMHTLNGDLARLVREGIISRDAAFEATTNKKDLVQYLGL